jgi:transcriptional regulator with XRE-family HTH domain
MDISTLGSGLTVGELLLKLRRSYGGHCDDIYRAIRTSSATYRKIERGERELSFLMALRLCDFFRLDLHEFISLLSDEELNRQDSSTIRALERMEKRKKEQKAVKIVGIASRSVDPDPKSTTYSNGRC